MIPAILYVYAIVHYAPVAGISVSEGLAAYGLFVSGVIGAAAVAQRRYSF